MRGERSAQGLTLDDMASRSGLARQVYYRLETGQRHASMGQLEQVAGALGLTMTELVEAAQQRAARKAAISDAQGPASLPNAEHPDEQETAGDRSRRLGPKVVQPRGHSATSRGTQRRENT